MEQALQAARDCGFSCIESIVDVRQDAGGSARHPNLVWTEADLLSSMRLPAAAGLEVRSVHLALEEEASAHELAEGMKRLCGELGIRTFVFADYQMSDLGRCRRWRVS